MWASHRPGLILKAKGWCFMQKRFNRGRSGGPKRGSETPPHPDVGPRPPPAQKHTGSAGMLGHLAQSAGTLPASSGEMRPSEARLGIREAKEVTHVVVLPGRAEDLRGEAPVGFVGETSGAQAGWRVLLTRRL